MLWHVHWPFGKRLWLLQNNRRTEAMRKAQAIAYRAMMQINCLHISTGMYSVASSWWYLLHRRWKSWGSLFRYRSCWKKRWTHTWSIFAHKIPHATLLPFRFLCNVSDHVDKILAKGTLWHAMYGTSSLIVWYLAHAIWYVKQKNNTLWDLRWCTALKNVVCVLSFMCPWSQNITMLIHLQSFYFININIKV